LLTRFVAGRWSRATTPLFSSSKNDLRLRMMIDFPAYLADSASWSHLAYAYLTLLFSALPGDLVMIGQATWKASLIQHC